MEDNDKDLTQDNLVDDLIQSLYGFSDEQLVKEFEEAEQDTISDPNIQVYPDEFDRIWEDICAECPSQENQATQKAGLAEVPARKKKLSWKKVAVLALAAVLMTASICFVAVGKKSYFYREREQNKANNNVVFNNDTNFMVLDDQESAYLLIEEILKIKPFKLGYIPYGMEFDSLRINDRRAIIKFLYDDEAIYLEQAADQTEVSNSHKSDGRTVKSVKNLQLNKEVLIKKETDNSGKVTFGAQFAYKESFCWLYGTMNESEFVKIVERIIY